MIQHKEIFQDVRKTLGNHYDKSIVRYYQFQNTDEEQINHISGKEMIRSEVFNRDCLEAMKEFPDGYFDLAVVDPPYGIDINNSGTFFKEKYQIKTWDKEKPNNDYFNELKRVSKNQIIWGGNYYFDNLENCKCFLIWDKKIHDAMSFAMCEIGWTSFKSGAKIFNKTSTQTNRIHPTQKPVALYDWIFKNYATEGMKILDTHLGSQSSRISAYKYKMDFTGYELDTDYFDQGCKRFEDFKSQLTLF